MAGFLLSCTKSSSYGNEYGMTFYMENKFNQAAYAFWQQKKVLKKSNKAEKWIENIAHVINHDRQFHEYQL
jgi:hypothetical protein